MLPFCRVASTGLACHSINKQLLAHPALRDMATRSVLSAEHVPLQRFPCKRITDELLGRNLGEGDHFDKPVPFEPAPFDEDEEPAPDDEDGPPEAEEAPLAQTTFNKAPALRRCDDRTNEG